MLNAIDTSAVTGRSGKPLLQFKARDNGTWSYGQRHTVVEAGSRWAVDPTSFQRGYVCFAANSNKPLGERLVSISSPAPDPATLPDKGGEWSEQWAVGMKCISGVDTGIEVTFKSTTNGGAQAVAGLIETVRDRLNHGQPGGKVSPIVLLEKDSYPHSQYGKIWKPLLPVVDWMPLSGPAPAPTPASPPPAEQPRRRRVG